MPNIEKSGSDGIQESGKGYASHDFDIEANKSLQTPTTPTFPGATYGLNPSDQPSHPPRRVKSSHSLKQQKSIASLHKLGDSIDPTLQLPSSLSLSQAVDGTTTNNADNSDSASAEELAWGPSHPCFPHSNPHVPLSSPFYQTTRIIRIRRDWMIAGDLAPTYSNIYPEILDPLLSEPEFRQIINHINTTLLDAFDPFSTLNWLDGLLGLLTGWLWEDFHPKTGVKGKLRNLELWIEEWNETVGIRSEVRLIPLRRTGYMGLDIQIPDPQVKVVDRTISPTGGGGGLLVSGDRGSYGMNNSHSHIGSMGLENGSVMASVGSKQ